MGSKSVFFLVLTAVLLERSTPISSRKEYIGSCTYHEGPNLINDIVTLHCYDSDAQTNKVFPQQTSVYLECANKRKANGYQAGNVVFQNNCQMSRIKHNISTVFNHFHMLNISDIELQSLPSSFFINAKFLKTLIASNNRLLEIPAFQFAQCPVLVDVDYSYNKIKYIDGNALVGVSSTMKKFNLSYNHLTELPPNFFLNLSKLEVLDLSYNSIEHLVPFANLSKLVHLNLTFNNIKDLPDAIFLSQPDLQYLQLSHNNLTAIKMEVFAKQNRLHLLDLSYNSIRKIDFNATRMEHLEKLYINDNRLSDLDGFKNLLFPILNSFAINGNEFNCSHLKQFLDWFDYHSSLSALHLINSTQFNDTADGEVQQVHGIVCYNVSNPSTTLLVETTTVSVGTSTDTFSENALTPQTVTNFLNADTITTEPIAQYNENLTHKMMTTDATKTSNSIINLLIFMCVSLVAFNVGFVIITIIRNRKSTSAMNGTNYNCAYNTELGRRFNDAAIENFYEPVLAGGKGCANNSDL